MVYRSRLLLDQDVAAREAGLARIYADLGFQELALVEGWKSVNTDPTNYSAHRFLADSYSALPRHEIARVSELLQSQLLQPLNISPLQPSLSESNLFVVANGGPSSLSFNEFNPLFERNRLGVLANGVVGEHGTIGEEIVVSGLYNKISGSAGQYHYETDGFRENNDLKDDIYNAYVQASVTPNTSVQMEYRHRKTEKGDLQLRFFKDDFSTNRRQEVESDTFTVGFHHKFSPGSNLIGFFMNQKLDQRLSESPDPALSIDSRSDGRSNGGEAQYIHGLENVKFILGAGYYKTESDDTANVKFTFIIDPDLPPFVDESTIAASTSLKHVNAYLYSYVNLPGNIVLTIGASGDFFNSDTLDKNQFNPKFGITWNPAPNTTLRAAAFKALKRTLITNQTLEPTQVAGFNQFYDDRPATDSWRYGVGVDQKFSQNVYGGAEYSYRDLDVPFIIVNTNEVATSGWDERLARAYIYYTPHKWVALRAEYVYEQFRQNTDLNIGIEKVETNRFPLGINFFHPSGLGATAGATYFRQHGDFIRTGNVTSEAGDDQFWLVDAGISYRLPQRYGFVSLFAKNLFDKSFQFFDTNDVNPAIQPVRTFYAKINLSY
jgi:opacity protein-like surface antigen